MSKLETKGTNADSLGLDHLHAFLAVVEAGTQVRAAKVLRLSQGTVSRRIDRLQEHFGGGLFEAGSSGPLSARGRLVEQAAHAALAELSRTKDLLIEGPVLRVGFIHAVRPLVERALRKLVNAHRIPDFNLRLFELSTEAQERALARNELDIAVSYATPAIAERRGIEESLVTEEPFALVLPERAWVRGKPSSAILSSLLYAHSPRRVSSQLAAAGETWLIGHRVTPKQSIECEHGTEILAYAGSGHGFGFLPALWSIERHDGVVFAPLSDFTFSVKIAAYSRAKVNPWVTRLREDLSLAARTALRDFRAG